MFYFSGVRMVEIKITKASDYSELRDFLNRFVPARLLYSTSTCKGFYLIIDTDNYTQENIDKVKRNISSVSRDTLELEYLVLAVTILSAFAPLHYLLTLALLAIYLRIVFVSKLNHQQSINANLARLDYILLTIEFYYLKHTGKELMKLTKF